LKRSGLLIAGYLFLVVAVIFAMSRYHTAEKNARIEKAQEYSRFFAHYLWTINQEDAQEFLKVIVSDNRISSLKVTYENGDSFVAFERQLPEIAFPAHVLERSFREPVIWDGEEIGELTITSATYNVAADLYAAAVLMILAAALTYYLSYASKQKQFEELTRRATAVFTNTSEAIFISDTQGNIQSVNPAFEQITGYRQQEIIGKNCFILLATRHEKDEALTWWKDALKSGEWQGEFWLRRHNGSEIPISTSVSGIPGRNGKLELFTAMFRDITEQKEAETKLLEATARLAEAENLAHLGSWAWDILSGDIWYSDEVYEIFGVDPASHSMDDQTFLSFVHPNDYQMAKHVLLGCIADRSQFNGIFRIVRTDGEVRTVELASRYSIENGKESSRLVGFVHDITEMVRNEEALRTAKDEAERANLAKSRFLAAASHDLRQPLQALAMFVAALGDSVRRKGAMETHKQNRLIGNIENSIEALAGLLNSLLDISRLDAGIMEPVKRPFPVSQTLEWVRNTFREEAKQKGIDLVVVPSAAVIETDPTLLQRIVGNLVSNAVRYTPTGKILVGCRRRGADLRLEVWDTGGGIPDDKMDLIFQEFQQLDNPGRQREHGLGLGLSIVQRVADLLDHPLDAKSWVGKGSVFSVVVPACADIASEPDAHPRHSTTPQKNSLTPNILVVDDDPAVLDGMTALMDAWSFDVLAAESSEDALRLCRERKAPLDLIIADYRLQDELTGADTINKINHELGWSIPGIIITGDTAPERLQEVATSGFALLHKPVQPDVLKKLIGETLADDLI